MSFVLFCLCLGDSKRFTPSLNAFVSVLSVFLAFFNSLLLCWFWEMLRVLLY